MFVVTGSSTRYLRSRFSASAQQSPLAQWDRAFLKAFGVSSATSLCVNALVYAELATGPIPERPWVIAPLSTMVPGIIVLSTIMGAMGGAVAVGVSSLAKNPQRG
jgi:hypothetical protein